MLLSDEICKGVQIVWRKKCWCQLAELIHSVSNFQCWHLIRKRKMKIRISWPEIYDLTVTFTFMKSTVGGFYELYIFQPFSLSVFVPADTTKHFYVEEEVIEGLLQKSLLYIILVKYHCNKFQGIFKILSSYCNF